MVYQAVVLGVLLYAVETLPIKQSNLHSLEVFHHCCLRNILGIPKSQQIAQHISNEEVRHRMGLLSPLLDIISSRWLRWLGHLARMGDHRLPKQMLFGWLPQPRPPHGPRVRWWDRIRKDLKLFQIGEGGWYVVAQNRDKWRQLCATSPSLAAEPVQQQRFYCDTCNRYFRRAQDMARHRCDSIRSRRAAGTGVAGISKGTSTTKF